MSDLVRARVTPDASAIDAVADRFSNGGGMQSSGNEYGTSIAVMKPRSLSKVAARCQEEAQLSGDAMFYAWGAGKNRVEGPSVKLALALARNYGNCLIGQKPVQETADSYIFTAVFVDRESNFTLERQFRQAKDWQVYGSHDEARKEDVRFQIGQSKAARNVILAAMPPVIIDQMMEAAKDQAQAAMAAKVGKEGLPAVRDKCLKMLSGFGVKEPAVLERFGLAKVAGLDVGHLTVLAADIKALDRREAEVGDLFPAAAPQAKDTAEPKVAAAPPSPPTHTAAEAAPETGDYTEPASPKPPSAPPSPGTLFPNPKKQPADPG